MEVLYLRAKSVAFSKHEVLIYHLKKTTWYSFVIYPPGKYKKLINHSSSHKDKRNSFIIYPPIKTRETHLLFILP